MLQDVARKYERSTTYSCRKIVTDQLIITCYIYGTRHQMLDDSVTFYFTHILRIEKTVRGNSHPSVRDQRMERTAA